MATSTVTGGGTLTLFDRIFNDFGNGDTVSITFPNDLIAVNTGKNGNAIYSKSEQGSVADMVVRILSGSSDDRFLQGKLSEMEQDLPSFGLVEGEFVKRLGDGQGNVINETFTLKGGVFLRNVDGRENVDGDTDQAITVYNLRFNKVVRSQG